MSCARIQQRFEAAREYWFQLTDIAKAVINSQALKDVRDGLLRIPQVGNIVRSALFDRPRESRSEESNGILRQAISTNLVYYVAPVGLGMGFNWAASGTMFETLTSSMILASSIYFFERRLVDNSLYTATLIRAETDETVRNATGETFKKLVPDLVRILSRAFAKREHFEAFFLALKNKIEDQLFKYFEDPNLYKHRHLAENFSNDLYEILVIELTKPTSAISPNNIAQPFANALTKMLLARLGPNRIEPPHKFDEQLKSVLKQVGLEKYSEGIEDMIAFHAQRAKSVMIPAKCSHAATEPCGSLFSNPVKYLADMGFIYLIGRLLPWGRVPEFILTAQFYGRGLREIKLTQRCQLDRIHDLSSEKALTFGIGLPFTAAIYGISNWFMRDAVLSLMLLLWTVAEQKNVSPVKLQDPSLDFFRASRYATDFLLWGGGKVGSKLVESLRKPKGQKLLVHVKTALYSSAFHWLMTALLGDPSKVVFPKLKKEYQSLFDLDFTKTPSAVAPILKDISSMKLFLKFQGNDIRSGIVYARQARVYKPWLVSPFLVLVFPSVMSSMLSLALHLLKEKGLDDLFGQINAAIDDAKKSPLELTEQTVKMLEAPGVTDSKEFQKPKDEKPQPVAEEKSKPVVALPVAKPVVLSDVTVRKLINDAGDAKSDVAFPHGNDLDLAGEIEQAMNQSVPSSVEDLPVEDDFDDEADYVDVTIKARKYNPYSLSNLRDSAGMTLNRCAQSFFNGKPKAILNSVKDGQIWDYIASKKR